MSVLVLALPVALLVLGAAIAPVIPAPEPTAELGDQPGIRPTELARRTWPVLGVVLAWWTGGSAQFGRGLMLAPAAFGAAAVLGALAADALTPRRRGTVRTAGLTPRRVRDDLPARLSVLLAGFAAALAAVLAAATMTASADDLGRPGRAFTHTDQGVVKTFSPWPGSYYSLPLSVVLLAGTAVCALALRRLSRRPVVGQLGSGPDELGRRAGATGVVAAWGIMITGTLAGVGLVVLGALHGLSGIGLRSAFWVLLPIVVGTAITALYCLAVLCSPARRRA